MRDHGGDLDAAIAAYGGAAADWIDLSTGINRVPYPVPPLPARSWTALPTRADRASLSAAAAAAYQCQAAVLPVAGAQAAIQMIPRLSAPGSAKVLGPTYNEHTAALKSAGWQVEEVGGLAALRGADLAVLVNPNNPDGRRWPADALMDTARHVGRLVVDESFADPDPADSLACRVGESGILVLRSFGKFYGLAGLRLGFVLGSEKDIAALSDMAGPWPVSGAAIAIGCAALSDRDWADRTRRRLAEDAARLDRLAIGAGWSRVGGTSLFRLYDTGSAAATQDRLARAGIWSRRFPWHERRLRLGLPGAEGEWLRLTAALGGKGTGD
ncbi:MAG: threonine-phosphate decarboxylase [Rhodobacteraceae bacterium]|nr:threonine-phosphate decarboxylase [Paracoccaceae bacterium]